MRLTMSCRRGPFMSSSSALSWSKAFWVSQMGPCCSVCWVMGVLLRCVSMDRWGVPVRVGVHAGHVRSVMTACGAHDGCSDAPRRGATRRTSLAPLPLRANSKRNPEVRAGVRDRSPGPVLTGCGAADVLHGGGPPFGPDRLDLAPALARVGREGELADRGVVGGVCTDRAGRLDVGAVQ